MKNSFEQDELKSRITIPSETPEFINQMIDETLKNLESRSRRHSTLKTTLAAAVCIGIVSLGTLAVSGQGLPVIKSLVQFVNPPAVQNYATVKKDVNTIAAKANDQGITLTVDDMAFDGTTLIVGFEVNRAEGFGDKDKIGADLMPSFQPEPTEKEGSKAALLAVNDIICETADAYLSRQNNNNYKGYASFYFGDAGSKIKDNYKLALIANSVDDVNGIWKIDTGLTRKDIYTPAMISQSSTVHQFEKGTVDSVKISRSALNNVVCLEGVYNASDEDLHDFPGFFILDEKGNCLNYNELGKSIADRTNKFKNDISIMKIPKDTKKLTIIPNKISSPENAYCADITKLPASIHIGDKEIDISGIERSQGKLILHYSISGLTNSRYFTYFDFIDKNGNMINQKHNEGKRMNPLDYESGKGTYELETDKPDEIVKVVCHECQYKALDQYQFDINLQ